MMLIAGLLLGLPGVASTADTRLLDAAKEGDLMQAELLIASGVDVNGKNERGNSPLHVATAFGREAVVRQRQ
jgi:ankyrin repeat protein